VLLNIEYIGYTQYIHKEEQFCWRI